MLWRFVLVWSTRIFQRIQFSSQFTLSSALFLLVSSSTPVISCLTYSHTMPDSDEEVQDQIEAVFGFRPCLWQIHVVHAILDGDDVITNAPMGSGKSTTYWMPVLFIKYGISVIVTPLKLLGAQFSEMLEGVGISAVSITADNATNELFNIRDLSHQLLTMR